MARSLVIGSRGSKLALWQAEQARKQLQLLNPGIDIKIEIIKTTGDVKSDPLSVIGGQGVFTKELEDALLDGRIDIAVHSLKDLPTILPDGLSISAICKREDPSDALVLRSNLSLDDVSLAGLPEGATVGTSSQRRAAQLKAVRRDVIVKDLRGNVDTRIRKLDEGQYDALILAAAGLKRLGLQHRISAVISLTFMVSAVGQGAIAIETRSDDVFAVETTAKLDFEDTRFACLAERAFLRGLGGGCQLPIAAHGNVDDDERRLTLHGLVASRDGSQIIRDYVYGPPEDAEALGAKLAARLIERGALSLLNENG